MRFMQLFSALNGEIIVSIEETLGQLVESNKALAEANKGLTARLITLEDCLKGLSLPPVEQAAETPAQPEAEQAAKKRVVEGKNRKRYIPEGEPETLKEKMAQRRDTGKPEYQPKIETRSRVIAEGTLQEQPQAEQAAPAEKPAEKPAEPAPAKAAAPAEKPQAEQAENPYGSFPVQFEHIKEVTDQVRVDISAVLVPWIRHAITVDKKAVLAIFEKYSGIGADGLPKVKNPQNLSNDVFLKFVADCKALGEGNGSRAA